MIQIYQHYFEELEESIPKLLNANFVIAFISSPFRANVKNLKNAYAIKIYFTHIKSKDVYSYVYAWDALSSIFIGHSFNINLEEDVEYISLKEVHERYGFYNKLFNEKGEAKDIHDEFLTIYTTREGNKVIIPCIVLVQSFYTKSQSNSLFDALTHPNGIKSMVKSCKYQGIWEGMSDYFLKLDGKSHKADRAMLFYFSRDKTQTEYFNKLGYQIQNEAYVKISIPKTIGSLTIEAEYTRIATNTLYIRNILHSDLINNDIDKFSFEYEHPKSKKKKNKSDKRDFDYDVFQEYSETDGIVDDNEIASANDTDITVSAEGINLGSVGDGTYNSRQLKKGQEEDRGGRIQIIHTDKVKKATFRDKSISNLDANAKPIKFKQENDLVPGMIETEGDIWYEKILIEFKKYFEVNNQNYIMPINQDKKYASSFLDKDKKKRRRYVIIELNGEVNGSYLSFFYIDVEKDETKRQKSALILNKNSIIVDEKKLVQEILYAHVGQWGDIWKKNIIIKQRGIPLITHKHTKTISSNVQELIKKVLKEFI